MDERTDYIGVSSDEIVSGLINVHIFWFELNWK